MNNEPVFQVGQEDIIAMCLERNERCKFEWTEDVVLKHMDRFKKGIEWADLDGLWDAISEVASNIEEDSANE